MIGIIGGYGAVGFEACITLQQLGIGPLKIGGRNPDIGKAKQQHFLSNASWEKLDVEHESSLLAFIQHCDLILNCSAPSHRYARRIAEACIQQGVHLVDVGMDPDYARKPLHTGSSILLYAAGATPGFSGLFPRWCAKHFGTVHSLLSYYGSLGAITPAAAEDYLEAVIQPDYRPRAAWRQGIVSQILTPQRHISLPFFNTELTLFPLFDAETHLVAQKLTLQNGSWYAAVQGEHTVAFLDSASYAFQQNRQATIAQLVLAAEMDSLGRSPYFKLLLQLDGECNGKQKTQTAFFQVDDIIPFCGKIAAIMVKAVMDGRVTPGLHHTAAIRDVDFVMEMLQSLLPPGSIQRINTAITDLLIDDEGSI
ncbi:saccharopine dehydrogenase NADP-binding domain-containing protein [Sphingobacterium sp. Mn56C]|uniref:saccharopine dehydrogenase NADP-binding domain-containing protein n=1 Tax=Sphingobacterium sp. Mn56C TaxID=3395261 RepID=UPI003BD5D190